MANALNVRNDMWHSFIYFFIQIIILALKDHIGAERLVAVYLKLLYATASDIVLQGTMSGYAVSWVTKLTVLMS